MNLITSTRKAFTINGCLVLMKLNPETNKWHGELYVHENTIDAKQAGDDGIGEILSRFYDYAEDVFEDDNKIHELTKIDIEKEPIILDY